MNGILSLGPSSRSCISKCLDSIVYSSSLVLALIMQMSLPGKGWAQTVQSPVYSIPPQPTGIQTATSQGAVVAVDNSIVVVGCPTDSTTDSRVGLVKIYNWSNGTLLYTLRCPAPAQGELFGSVITISGNHVVIGDPNYGSGATSASGRVYIYDLSSADPTDPVLTLEDPSTAQQLDHFGGAVSISGNLVAVGAPGKSAGVSNSGIAYVFDLSSSTPTTAKYTLKKTTPVNGDSFGSSIGISGTKIIVGAPLDSTQASRAGRAFLFDVSSGTVSGPTTFTDPNNTAAASDNFGNAVSISGSWLVIAAINGGDGSGGDGSGEVYGYNLAGTIPNNPIAMLTDPKKPGAFLTGEFGATVAISGSVAVVSAPIENVSGVTHSGSTYVFDISRSNPSTPTVTLENPTPAMGDEFGTSVAISGSQMVVGAPFDSTAAATAGSAYLYNVGSSSLQRTLNKTSPTQGDLFGISVAVSGSWLAVGAEDDPTSGTGGGSVTLYTLTGTGTLAPTLTFAKPTDPKVTFFGRAVAMSGSLLAVGADYDPGTGINVGVVYVYNVTNTHPLNPVAIIQNPAPTLFGNFGNNVAISGTRLVMGMTGSTSNPGGALVFDISQSTTNAYAALSSSDAVTGDLFGISVGISGNTVVVGSPSYGVTGKTNVGRVYVYNISTGGALLPTTIFDNPNQVAASRFGDAVAVYGTRIVVGLPVYNSGGVVGRVQVFDLASSTPTTPTVTINNPGFSGGFGTSVAISNQLVVVGSPSDPLGATNAGRTWIYDLAATVPATAFAVMNNPTPQTGEKFGFSVSIDGPVVGVGSPFDDMVALNKGAAYTYHFSAPLAVIANPPTGGSVTGGGTFTIGASQQVQANASSGWTFVGWSDGNTQSSRSVPVPPAGTTLTANFVPATFAAWQSQYFTAQQLANPAISGASASPLNDRVDNFFKFYFGINPTSPMTASDRAALPALQTEVDSGVPYATFTFRRNSGAAGLAVNLQMLSGTSAPFTWVTIAPDSTVVSSVDPLTGDQTVSYKINITGRTSLILRLSQP